MITTEDYKDVRRSLAYSTIHHRHDNIAEAPKLLMSGSSGTVQLLKALGQTLLLCYVREAGYIGSVDYRARVNRR